MKKHFILAAMAMTALFSACSNEDSTPLNEGTVPVTFTIGGIGSRVATTFSQAGTSTNFVDNDVVGIFSTGLGTTEMENVEYTYTSANGLTTTGTYNFPANGSDVTFKAYYPHTANITGKVINCSVLVDQTDITNFNNSDFIYATATGSATSPEVTLAFNHQMALVEVELGAEFTTALNTDETITTVGINVIKDATFNLDADASAIVSTSSARENILMYNDVTTSKYYAIVPAQTITGDGTTALFTITTTERAFSYKPSASSTEEFQAGKTTKIKLNVTGGTQELAVFKVSSVTINDWDANRPDENIQKEYGVTEDKLSIIATLPAVGNITTLTNGRAELTEAGWGAYNLTSAEVVEDAQNGNYIKAVGNATAGAWGSQGLYYWAGNEFSMSPDNSYILTFKAKSASSGQISIMVMKLSENKVFPIADVTTSTNIASVTASGTINSKTLTADWTEYKFKITPNLSMTGGYGNLTNAVTVSSDSDICIAIKGNSASSAYDIKEVTFVKF